MAIFEFEKNKFLPVFALESQYFAHQRKFITTIISVILFIFFIPLSYGFIQYQAPFLPELPGGYAKLRGLFYFFLGLRMSLFAANRFIASKAFDKKGIIASENLAERFNYFASELWYYGAYKPSATSFFPLLAGIPKTITGAHTLTRLGISLDQYNDFLATYPHDTQAPLNSTAYPLEKISSDHDITSGDILALLFQEDPHFHEFLLAHLVDKDAIRGSAQWVETMLSHQDQMARWWSRERLARIPGLAKTWAYGPIFHLQQFAVNINSQAASNGSFELIGHDHEVTFLEDALRKQTNANVIIVSDPGAGKETILQELTRMIVNGKVFPELESKRVFMLSGPALVATGKTKGETEALIMKVLNEAAYAGDIILVIEQFPEFIESLDKLGILASQILDVYLAHPNLHIIAMADTFPFRKHVENNAAIMAHFEKIIVEELDEEKLLLVLQDIAPRIEASTLDRIIMTYTGLQKIAESAVRYLVEGALPQRAIGLLQEIMNHASTQHVIFITPEFVSEYVGKKTKIPLGAIDQQEQEKLMNLEDKLHERVVNQVEAINTVANAIRRARAGIQEPKRPIGSFLFLGPTGVGKTETAKALAAVYFGDEDSMTRFDMTEYQTENALDRLIGTIEHNEPGILASRMRTSPYAVILLDEFEKSDKKVADLFLQILDEGYFTDAFGEHVNMRNTIIIATSNAGGQLIWQMVDSGADLTAKKSEIIAHIQEESIFKPELLNRFDSIVMFQPLSPDHLHQVSKFMLKKLADRLKEQQDITFIITDGLVAEIVRKGYDPTFGARPMRRFIQDNIEKVIAEKIIKHELVRGESVALEASDLM